MSSRVFYSAFLCFFLGIFAASVTEISFISVCFALLCILGTACVFRKKRSVARLVAIAAIAFAFGFARMNFSAVPSHPLDGLLGRTVSLTGVVCGEPSPKETTQNFCFSSDGSNDKILITASRYPEYFYGDALALEGVLALPRNFETYQGGPMFDYVSYLAKDGVRYVMMRPKIAKVSSGKGNLVMAFLLRTKSAFVTRMENLFPEPESSLLGGLLLGDRKSLPKDIIEDFKEAGLVHILVLSGYNVTIVADIIMKLCAFLPRLIGRLLGVVSIVLFALMTGASATTIRASIMALIALLARSTDRRYSVSRALIVAAFFMVLENPLILVFDASFELSFLSTLGLIIVSPLVSERLGFVTERFKLREIVSTTVSTQLFVLPFLLYTMGQISVISFISNIFVLPVIPYAMLFGSVSIALGFLSEFLAQPIAWIAALPLSYILRAVSFFGHVPFASVQMHANAFALACLYGAYAVVLIRAWQKRSFLRPSAS